MRLTSLVCLGLVSATSAYEILYIANFNMDGITGTINVTQDTSTPVNTTITTDLEGLTQCGDDGCKWHVHVYPVEDSCDANSVGGHYDPYNTGSTCGSGIAVSNCEVGDLAGKHGVFMNGTSTETFYDSNLPLYGKYSIGGRSIVIHAEDGSRVACATLLPRHPYMVKALFDDTLGGTITLLQDADNAEADVSILVNLKYSDSSASATYNHKWHVHQYALSPYEALMGADVCTEAGGHFNPYNGGACTTDEDDWSTCEMGDLAGKHGKLNLTTSTNKFFFTDTALRIRDSTYYVNETGLRSIVVHAEDGGGSRISCATIGRQVLATFDGTGEDGDPAGFVEFLQNAEDDYTHIYSYLSGISYLPNPFHVHNYPVEGYSYFNPTTSCAASHTGGHFTGTGSGSCTTNMSTWDDCEFGDTSGKFGKLTKDYNESFVFVGSDPYLTLHGKYSIVGRSVVIHKSNGARYACANINYGGSFFNESLNQAIANFNSSDIYGRLIMTQHANDMNAPTTVKVDMSYFNSADSSEDHNYHVHEYKLDDAGTCSSAGGHWNPKDAVTTLCDTLESRWGDCEIGDLSGKHGTIDLPSTGSSKVFYTDTMLPLDGDYSVGDLSIVVHAEDEGSSRFACANLTLNAVEVSYSAPSPSPNNNAASQLSAPQFLTLALTGLMAVLLAFPSALN